MRSVTINFDNNFDAIKQCVRFFDGFTEDINAKRNHFEVDGKSVMGIIALGADVPITFTIHSGSSETDSKFVEGLQKIFGGSVKC